MDGGALAAMSAGVGYRPPGRSASTTACVAQSCAVARGQLYGCGGFFVLQPSVLDRISALLMREPESREQLITLLRSCAERNLLDADALAMIERLADQYVAAGDPVVEPASPPPDDPARLARALAGPVDGLVAVLEDDRRARLDPIGLQFQPTSLATADYRAGRIADALQRLDTNQRIITAPTTADRAEQEVYCGAEAACEVGVASDGSGGGQAHGFLNVPHVSRVARLALAEAGQLLAQALRAR